MQFHVCSLCLTVNFASPGIESNKKSVGEALEWVHKQKDQIRFLVTVNTHCASDSGLLGSDLTANGKMWTYSIREVSYEFSDYLIIA